MNHINLKIQSDEDICLKQGMDVILAYPDSDFNDDLVYFIVERDEVEISKIKKGDTLNLDIKVNVLEVY